MLFLFELWRQTYAKFWRSFSAKIVFRDRHQGGRPRRVVLRNGRRDVVAKMFRRNAKQEEQAHTHRRTLGERSAGSKVIAPILINKQGQVFTTLHFFEIV